MNVEFSPIGWLDRCKILVAKATEIGKKIKGKMESVPFYYFMSVYTCDVF